jgi:uncharacterized protein involved in outer membrane biogenesis
MKARAASLGFLNNKIYKRYFFAAASAIGAFLVLATLAPYFFSSEYVKSKIIQSMGEITTHDMKINGDVELQGLPYPNIRIHDVALSSPRNFRDMGPLLKSESIDIELDFFSILIGSVQPKAIILNNPYIQLHINKNGEKNWAIHKPKNDKTNDVDPDNQERREKQSADEYVNDALSSIPASILYSVIEVRGGTIEYSTHDAESVFQITDYNQVLTLQGPDDELFFEGSGFWNDIKSNWSITFSSMRYLLSKNRTKIQGKFYNKLGSLNTKGFYENGAYRGNLNFSAPSIRKLSGWMLSNNPLEGLPSKLGISVDTSQIECARLTCAVANANFKIDKIQGLTSFSWNYGADIPVFDVEIAASRVNLTPILTYYLENKKFEDFEDLMLDADGNIVSDQPAYDPFLATDNTDNTKETKEGWSVEPFDLSYLSGVDANIKISIKESFKIGNLEFNKGQFAAKLQDGYLSVQLSDTLLYKGTTTVRMNIDTKGAPIGWQLFANIGSIDSVQLLGYLLDLRFLQGTSTLQANLTSQGDNVNTIINNLQGTGLLLVNDGRIKGINLPNMFRNADNAFIKNNRAITEFNAVQLTFDIDKGVINNKDMVIKTNIFEAKGAGILDLPKFVFDYRLTPTAVNKPESKGQNKTFFMFPVTIKGDIYKPDFAPATNNKISSSELETTKASTLSKNPPENNLSNTKNAKKPLNDNKASPANQSKTKNNLDTPVTFTINKPGETQQKLLNMQRVIEWQKKQNEINNLNKAVKKNNTNTTASPNE